MQNYLYEFLGTALLVLLGDAVVANVILNKTKGQNSGWIVITMGWACAVLIPALMFTKSGAAFNPALVLGLAVIGKMEWAVVPGYIIAEMLGGFVGAILGVAQTSVGEVAAVGTFAVGAIIFACGASLGGTTGYAMNPARDLGPRFAHAILPIPNKRDSDWSYSWIPVFGPVCGGILGALLAAAVF